MEVPEGLNITTMTRYNAEFPFNIAFPPGSMDDVLAEWLGKQGVKQCHIAGESSPHAHTYTPTLPADRVSTPHDHPFEPR